MPYYSFRCQDCGEFTVWHRSSKGNKLEEECPTCSNIAKRVFTPPTVYRMDGKLKQTIESGMEPKLVKKENMPVKPKKRAAGAARPWQTGH